MQHPPAAGASGSTAVFTITSRDRTATILFGRRNWENTISSGCATYKNIIVCLHSFKAACLSLPSLLPGRAGRLWTGTLAHCCGTMGWLTSFSLLRVMSAVRINSRTNSIFFWGSVLKIPEKRQRQIPFPRGDGLPPAARLLPPQVPSHLLPTQPLGAPARAGLLHHVLGVKKLAKGTMFDP